MGRFRRIDAFRAQFPVLERVAYLNAGSCGPVPQPASDAARDEIARQAERGRGHDHFVRRGALADRLRAGYARVLGARPEDVALTSGTSEGLARVLNGLGLGPGDEVLTSDSEHPGLLGPLAALRGAGVAIRTAPLPDLPEAVGPRTTVVACSHVSWITGEVAPAALAELDVPVVLDGAQGAGAVPIDLAALGCVAYAAAGQKWLCGADGSGMLWIDPAFRPRVRCLAPSYMSFVDAGQGLEAQLKEEAAIHDAPALAAETVAFSLAALEVVEQGDGARGRALARRLAERLEAGGRTVAPRGDTTLVAWEEPEPQRTVERLVGAGVLVRDVPNTPYLRASVGRWNDEEDLDRLLGALA